MSEDFEMKVIRVYDAKGLAAAGKAVHMTHAEVLHMVGKYRRMQRLPSPECRGCSFAICGKPCVMPIGICGLEAFRRKNRG